MGFPERLLAIARFVSKGSVVADIGTDHALLPIYLITNHISSRVIAADLNKGPLEAARKNILEAGLSDQITTRLGNGLEVLEPGEVKEIIIAGMGGTTIKSIISSAEVIARPVRKFIFQPMADADLLRIWLSQNGWKIDDEELIKEDGRIYEIMSVSPGQEKTDNKLIISIGPRLYEKKHPLLKELLQSHVDKIEKILANLSRSRDDQALIRQEMFSGQKRDLERIIQCL